jgi:hypothetical protein
MATKRASPIEKLWLIQQFDSLHKEHLLILQKIDEIKLNVPPFVLPELEAQILTSIKLAKQIDDKVPDKNVPPGLTPN